MKCALLLSGMVLSCATFAVAQERDADFLARAKTATVKYQDQSAAILDGYRPIGKDFPGMGVHWVRIGILFDGAIDAEHPEFLTYIVVSGAPKLAGVAYALPLLPGETGPDSPAGKEAWHDHFRSIDEETMAPHHHQMGTAQDEPRLSMLHAWIWTPNPDGVFAADNWALPYIRLGLIPPADAPRSEALALTLLSGGVGYFSDMVDTAATPSKKQRARIDQAFERARAGVEHSVQQKRLEPLSFIWAELWKSIDSAISPQAQARLQSVLPHAN